MLVAGSNRCVFGVDRHSGMVVTGHAADGRQIVNRAREESQNYKDTYGHNVIPSILANRLSLYVHYFTLYGSLRPFGSTAIVATYDDDDKEPQLYMVEPSGASYRFFGCAAGKGANAAKTEIEKLLNKQGTAGITCRDAVNELARILHVIRDPAKDKPLELEIGWLCAENNNVFGHVPKNLVQNADAAALAELDSREAAPAESEAMQEEQSTPVASVETEEKEMDVISDL
jgi:20S proteasome subunit alpha 7